MYTVKSVQIKSGFNEVHNCQFFHDVINIGWPCLIEPLDTNLLFDSHIIVFAM